jgi:hypothetical protein
MQQVLAALKNNEAGLSHAQNNNEAGLSHAQKIMKQIFGMLKN